MAFKMGCGLEIFNQLGFDRVSAPHEIID